MMHLVDRSHTKLSTLQPNEELLSDVAPYLLTLLLVQMLEDCSRKEPLRLMSEVC